MKAYKGFNKDMTCRGFQFEEGKTYEEKEAKLCEKGFHACLNPIDVFKYYPLVDSIYHSVEIDDDDVSKECGGDSKICGKKIKIGAKLTPREMIQAGVKIDIASASGDSSRAVTSANYSPAATSGKCSAAATSGDSSPAATSGRYSHAATSGVSSPAATSGDSSHAVTSGKCSPASTSGDYSIAAAIGRNSKAKSTIGNWIVLAEYGEWNGKTYPVLCVKCGKIDGVSLKPDTWYQLKNGEFVEV